MKDRDMDLCDGSHGEWCAACHRPLEVGITFGRPSLRTRASVCHECVMDAALALLALPEPKRDDANPLRAMFEAMRAATAAPRRRGQA